MSEWRECKLGDIATLHYGKGLKAENRIEGHIPVFSSAGLTGYHNQALADSKGLIIGRKGTIGKVYYSKHPFWCIDTAYYILPDDERYNFDYLYYLIQTLGLEELNEDSAVPGLNRETAYAQDISIPDLREQKAIAGVLSSLDDKIDLLHRQNKTLEQMAEALFRQWFIEEASEDWEEKPLSFFGDIICGKTPSKSNLSYFGGNIPFIKIPDMHEQTFIFNTTDSLSELGKDSQKNKTLPAKSICVSCIATVGLVSMNIIESQTNQQINSIIPKKDYYRYFLYLFMKSSSDVIHALASGGTATLNLNTGDFSKILVPFSGDNLLNIFNGKVYLLFDKIFVNQKQIQTLEKLRDNLLPKLMSGEIRVKPAHSS